VAPVGIILKLVRHGAGPAGCAAALHEPRSGPPKHWKKCVRFTVTDRDDSESSSRRYQDRPGQCGLESHAGESVVTAWAEPDGLTRAKPLELCDESVARTVPSQYNPERRETSIKEIQPLLRHVHGCGIRVSGS
jgi:hypothetical protein